MGAVTPLPVIDPVKETLCGGNRDFALFSHPQLGPMYILHTKPYDSQQHSSLLPGMFVGVSAVMEKYKPEDGIEDMYSGMFWHGELGGYPLVAKVAATQMLMKEMKAFVGLDVLDAQNVHKWMGGDTPCKDSNPLEADWSWSAATLMTGATSCGEAKPFCDDKNFPLVRLLCPETCGCTRMDSGILDDTGCREVRVSPTDTRL